MYGTYLASLDGKWKPLKCLDALVPVEGREEAAGRQHERSSGQNGASIIDPLQVTSRHVRHANSAS